MGDEPYAALLPWVVFAVVDRGHGDGPFWAAIGALITALTLIVTSPRSRSRSPQQSRNVILLGAVGWFAALALADTLNGSNTGLVAHDGRVLALAGFAVIAFGSLAFTPALEYYTRPHVRSSRWEDRSFRRLNSRITAIWGTTFACIAVSHALAGSMNAADATTVFYWVVPIALAAIAAHRSRQIWDEFHDDDEFSPDPIRGLSLDWQDPSLD